jgi:hypothetical protein
MPERCTLRRAVLELGNATSVAVSKAQSVRAKHEA